MAFEEGEAIHKLKRNINIEPEGIADIDDLIHENKEEDHEPIYYKCPEPFTGCFKETY